MPGDAGALCSHLSPPCRAAPPFPFFSMAALLAQKTRRESSIGWAQVLAGAACKSQTLRDRVAGAAALRLATGSCTGFFLAVGSAQDPVPGGVEEGGAEALWLCRC
jgi:hypothetical protein